MYGMSIVDNVGVSISRLWGNVYGMSIVDNVGVTISR